MKDRLIPALVLVVLMCASNRIGAEEKADSAKANEAFNKIRAVASDTSSKFPGATDLQTIVGKLSANAKALREKWAAGSEDGKIDRDYLATLEQDAASIKDALNAPDAASALLILKDVSADLDAKMAFASKTTAMNDVFIPHVEVTVATFSGGSPKSGLIVNCNTVRHESESPPMFPFTNPSSPTTSKIPPGVYVLWVTDPSGHKLVSRTVRIGLDGEKSTSLRIDIP